MEQFPKYSGFLFLKIARLEEKEENHLCLDNLRKAISKFLSDIDIETRSNEVIRNAITIAGWLNVRDGKTIDTLRQWIKNTVFDAETEELCKVMLKSLTT